MNYKKAEIFIVFIFLCMAPAFLSGALREIKNEFISIVGDTQTGRFILKTTGGDPELKTDNNVLILYEYDPPSSFTTIRIDGKNYVFGWNNGKFVQLLKKKGSDIICSWEINKIIVIQNLRIIKGPTTGALNTMEVSYKIWNNDDAMHNIGIRITLDTYLGAEDGAPFRIPGVGDITSENEIKGKDVPKYWYSYDNLKNPSVKAQGTLVIPNSPRPDRVVFASYARFYSALWGFPIEKGRSFKRGFLEPIDSAVGIYWEPREVIGDEGFVVKTCYGLYGSTIEKGSAVNVSLSGPSEVENESFLIHADVQNISSSKAENVSAKIKLPDGLKFTQKKKKNPVSIGSLDPEQLNRAAWEVEPDGTVVGEVTYSVLVTGSVKGNEIVPVEAKRKVVIIKEEEKKEKIEVLKDSMIEEFKEKTENVDVKKSDEGIIVNFGDINFKYDSAQLTPNAIESLDKIGLVITEHKNYNLNIYGHTDNKGAEDYNYKLSINRAKNVFSYLLKKGYITEYQAIYKGFGMYKPIADNKTEEGRKLNRRVEIIIIPE